MFAAEQDKNCGPGGRSDVEAWSGRRESSHVRQELPFPHGGRTGAAAEAATLAVETSVSEDLFWYVSKCG